MPRSHRPRRSRTKHKHLLRSPDDLGTRRSQPIAPSDVTHPRVERSGSRVSQALTKGSPFPDSGGMIYATDREWRRTVWSIGGCVRRTRSVRSQASVPDAGDPNLPQGSVSPVRGRTNTSHRGRYPPLQPEGDRSASGDRRACLGRTQSRRSTQGPQPRTADPRASGRRFEARRAAAGGHAIEVRAGERPVARSLGTPVARLKDAPRRRAEPHVPVRSHQPQGRRRSRTGRRPPPPGRR